jgi:hypothetical protein
MYWYSVLVDSPGVHIHTVTKVVTRAVKKRSKLRIFETGSAQLPNTRNESVPLLKILGMNLYTYGEYTE